jgi:hypothetical protein
MVLHQSRFGLSLGLGISAIALGMLPGVEAAAQVEPVSNGVEPAPIRSGLEPGELAQTMPAFMPPPGLNVLPVPDAEIPIGNIDGMPTISIPRDASQSRGVASPGLNRAAALGLSYRVVVPAANEQMQQQVRSLIPDAFRTWVGGQPMIQVGAYAGLQNAQDVVQFLGQYGIQATVQLID